MTAFLFDCALLPSGWARDVELRVDDRGAIASVRAGSDGTGAQRIEGVVLPGMPNAHSHAHQRAMTGLAEWRLASSRPAAREDSFWSWREVMYGYLAAMTPEQLQAVAAQLYVEMLKFGYTHVCEFQYLHHQPDGTPYANGAEMSLRCLEAAQEAGMGITLLPVLYRFGGFAEQRPEPSQQRFLNDAGSFLAIASEIQRAVADRPLACAGIAPHSLRAVSQPLLAEVLAAVPGGPVHIHIAEQRAEIDGCVAWSGLRPVQWLLENVAVDSRWCLVHATHCDPRELAAVAASGAVVGLCATTEANLGDGIFAIDDYVSQQGTFAIGSDSQVCTNPAEELRWMEYQQRLLGGRRNVLDGGGSTGRTLFEAALGGGAQASGAQIGKLAPGCRADFIALDHAHPRLLGRAGDRVLDSWIFACDENPIHTVCVGGVLQVVEGVHVRQEQIQARFAAAIAGMGG